MPNYQLGKIYAIRSYQTEKIYIGSTIQTLSKRISEHRIRYKCWDEKNYKRYESAFEICKFDDHYIELLENCPVKSRAELCRRQGQLIREKDCVNKTIAGRTKKEYYQDNNEKAKDKSKQYRENNKDKFRTRECECGGRYSEITHKRHLKSKPHRYYVEFMSLTEEQVRAIVK
tara:strand:+ start:3590 stop:4108 length:519 start_codon:yes stop_codon:yes gene_type:complete